MQTLRDYYLLYVWGMALSADERPEYRRHENAATQTSYTVFTLFGHRAAETLRKDGIREPGIKLLGRYAEVNPSEFIAEATAYFMKNQDNETALQVMKETVPQTYEYLTKLVSAGPFLNEKYFLDAVSRRK